MDSISAKLLRVGCSVIASPIPHILNLSLSQSAVPEAVKEARVVPLYKKGGKGEVGNYRIKGTLSDQGQVTCGVPQGSIVGPLLFLIYVNDMESAVDCDLLLYADDLALLIQGINIIDIEQKLSKKLAKSNVWFDRQHTFPPPGKDRVSPTCLK